MENKKKIKERLSTIEKKLWELIELYPDKFGQETSRLYDCVSLIQEEINEV